MSVSRGSGSKGVLSGDHGAGWLLFAGSLLIMVGTLNVIDGIAAISNSKFFVGNAQYVIADLKTWGWIVLLLGIAQCLIGAGVFVRNQFARWAGVVVVGFNAIAQLLMLPGYPLWSLAIFALDLIVMYGLIVHGYQLSSE